MYNHKRAQVEIKGLSAILSFHDVYSEKYTKFNETNISTMRQDYVRIVLEYKYKIFVLEYKYKKNPVHKDITILIL